MPSLLPTNLPSIFGQVQTQLTTFVSAITSTAVCGDVSNIYWVFEGEEPPPGTTGQRDVLLIQRKDLTENVQGDGRFCMIASGMDINLRTTRALDRRGTQQDWMTNQGTLINGLMDAMMGYFPVDTDQNAYTIEGFVMDFNAEPVKNRESKTWGETVGTYRFHYIPAINTTLQTV